MNSLTSPSNPKIKQIRALRQRKEREASGLFVVEGIRHVGEAFDAGADFAYVCYSPEVIRSDFARHVIETLTGGGVPALAVAKEVFVTLADKDNPSGILAVVHQPQRSLDDLSAENFPWGVALVSPQDPGNIGTILRTIDAVGASGLLLLEDGDENHRCADPYHPAAVRASMGTLFWHPVVTVPFANFAAWAAKQMFTLYGTSSHGSQPYEEIHHYTRPMILLMGSERQGLTPDQSAICHQLIRLPMKGHATSLNLAVAAGVMLYAMLAKLA